MHIEALKTLNNDSSEIDQIYLKFMEFVLEFVEISCKSAVSEAQRGSKSVESKRESFDLFEILVDLKKQKFENYKDLKSIYDSIVQRINNLNKQVLSETEISNAVLKKQILIGAIIAVVSAILTRSLS